MEIQISEASDWQLFAAIAETLEHGLKGEWTVKADGLDQRYWDLCVEGQTITLHLEHYLGISLLMPGHGESLEGLSDLGLRAYRLMLPFAG